MNNLLATKAVVKKWMRLHAKDHVDHKTGEVNATGLAESAADAFNLYEDRRDYTISEVLFSWSLEAASIYERQHR